MFFFPLPDLSAPRAGSSPGLKWRSPPSVSSPSVAVTPGCCSSLWRYPESAKDYLSLFFSLTAVAFSTLLFVPLFKSETFSTFPRCAVAPPALGLCFPAERVRLRVASVPPCLRSASSAPSAVRKREKKKIARMCRTSLRFIVKNRASLPVLVSRVRSYPFQGRVSLNAPASARNGAGPPERTDNVQTGETNLYV